MTADPSRTKDSEQGPGGRWTLPFLGRLLLVGLLCLGLVEIGARILVPEQPNVRLQQFAQVVEGKHEVAFEEVFQWDPELFWRLAPNVVLPDDARPLFGRVSNARGLREERELPLSKPAGETRILFVGDSCTFGYLVAYDESIPELVERKLREKQVPTKGGSIECINAGVPGYSLFQGWRYLETEGFELEPDLVILNFGWNAQTPWDGVGDAEQLARIRAARPPAALAWSRAARILCSSLAARPPVEPLQRAAGRPNIRPRLTPDEFGHILEEIHAATRRRGIGLMLLVPAMALNLEGERMVRTLYQDKQFAFVGGFDKGAADAPGLIDGVRILRSFQRENPQAELFSDGVHTSAVANERLADRISSRILAWLQTR